MNKLVVYLTILVCLFGGISSVQACLGNKVEVRAAAFSPQRVD